MNAPISAKSVRTPLFLLVLVHKVTFCSASYPRMMLSMLTSGMDGCTGFSGPTKLQLCIANWLAYVFEWVAARSGALGGPSPRFRQVVLSRSVGYQSRSAPDLKWSAPIAGPKIALRTPVVGLSTQKLEQFRQVPRPPSTAGTTDIDDAAYVCHRIEPVSTHVVNSDGPEIGCTRASARPTRLGCRHDVSRVKDDSSSHHTPA